MLGVTQNASHGGDKLKKAEKRHKWIPSCGEANAKAKIQSLNWSLDGSYILVSYRVVNRVILWDIENCTKRADIELDFDLIKAKLYPYNARYCIVSGAKVVLIDLEQGRVLNLASLEDESEKHRVYFSLTMSET